VNAYNFVVPIPKRQSRFLCEKLKEMIRDSGILSIREAAEYLHSM
jgi:hypothetical protein